MEVALRLPLAPAGDRPASTIWRPVLAVVLLVGFFSMHVLALAPARTSAHPGHTAHVAHIAHASPSDMDDATDPTVSVEADSAGGIHEGGTCLSSTPTSAGGHPASTGSGRVLPSPDLDSAASQEPPAWVHGHGLFSLCVLRS